LQKKTVLLVSKKTVQEAIMASLLKEAGLPDGVMNVANGDKVAVNALLTGPLIKAISFDGSTPIAEYIYTTPNTHGKSCQALGGRKMTPLLCLM
jgi:malonate-semialdehyde dehydrogenase (acetylating)/methylmalonate-semialdehyde dehydrogenase